MTDSKEAPSNEECTQMYHRANGITAKHPPITSAFIFEAMRYAFAEGQKAATSRMQAEIRAAKVEALREAAAKVGARYIENRQETGYDEGWNDGLDLAEQDINALADAIEQGEAK